MPLSHSFLSEEQLLCSICLDVFDNPVSTPCGHSFCMACIVQYWDSVKHCQCPLCKQTFKRKPDLHINRTLREITEQFKQMMGKAGACGGVGVGAEVEDGGRKQRSVNRTLKPVHLPGDLIDEIKWKFTKPSPNGSSQACHDKPRLKHTVTSNNDSADSAQPAFLTRQVSMRRFTLSGAADAMKVPLCPKHHRSLELFCQSDLECICVECGQTDHHSHNIICAEKEWHCNKMKIGIAETAMQEMTKERMQKVEEIKHSLTDIKVYSDLSTPLSIKDWTGVSLTCDLGTKAFYDSVCQILEQFEELQKQPAICGFTLTPGKHKATMPSSGRCRCSMHGLDLLPMQSKVLLDILLPSALGFSVSADQSPMRSHPKVKRIQEYAVDVTLDTNTAHPRLVLSEDRKKVWCVDRHQLVPNNRERFDRVVCVLGHKGFTGGRHYWEVEVGDKTDWDLGVAGHSSNRKGKIIVSPSNGYWFLSLRDKNNYAFRTEPSTALTLRLKPQKIGLFVDYEKGQVSFFNVDAKTLIYTFMDNFSETIFPFFSPCTNKSGRNDAPLVITPVLLD
ncbi:zinc finger protein RFP-like isoform X3 [Xyrauchen texanus]|uniref:zinc finger protein RFP-like isoform X3 n=1 Tax=Xyrauchen texanus TaxID=154827 RepID=UPI002242B9C7|nr:zinc finger protein RFP-like isoform X3 [Xyrauchen texanus]